MDLTVKELLLGQFSITIKCTKWLKFKYYTFQDLDFHSVFFLNQNYLKACKVSKERNNVHMT